MVNAARQLTVALLYCVFAIAAGAGLNNDQCTTNNALGVTVPDCNCKFHSVDYAVKHFLSPILTNLTTKAFFRYFKVNLDSPCPYWPEVGQCMMEGCAVCTCEENEIPKPWLETEYRKSKPAKNDYGWISSSSSEYGYEGQGHDDSLGRISVAEGESADMRLDEMYNDSRLKDTHTMEVDVRTATGIQRDPDEDVDNSADWTVLCQSPKEQGIKNLPTFASSYGYGALFEPVETAEEVVGQESYVNLLQNPERFTGYSGPSAQRVWKAIKEENCFGEITDVCQEKRIFYRLISGLQASISTHIARNYLHPSGQWGINDPLYWRAVGTHPDRLNNMYFAFLFLLRSVVRAQDTIRSYPYDTGHAYDDQAVVELLDKLLASSTKYPTASVSGLSDLDALQVRAGAVDGAAGENTQQSSPVTADSLKELLGASSGGTGEVDAMQAVEECRYGFNESELFQVSETLKGPQYWNTLEEKQELRDAFMIKFRNISRIMDCVTCEKCRVWGKLQILGFGTAIKILLHPVDKIVTPTATVSTNGAHSAHSPTGAATTTAEEATQATCKVLETKRKSKISLSRQEIIALLNTLNQFSNSLIFAAEAAERAGRQDIPEESISFASMLNLGSLGALGKLGGLGDLGNSASRAGESGTAEGGAQAGAGGESVYMKVWVTYGTPLLIMLCWGLILSKKFRKAKKDAEKPDEGAQ